jgi:hypothetical protein
MTRNEKFVTKSDDNVRLAEAILFFGSQFHLPELASTAKQK